MSESMAPDRATLTLTIKETATLLRVSPRLAYEAARRGEIPTLKLGGRILVPRAALEEMLRSAGTGDV